MRGRTQLALGAGLIALGLVSIVAGADQVPCPTCGRARYWTIPADDWTKSGPPAFPETERLAALRPTDLGVAFSGGGTRSATATLGELTGLAHNGWLPSVRYVTAISGGAWAAVPFTYSKDSLDRLLGTFLRPSDLEHDVVVSTPNGSLATAITNSSLASGSLQEAAAGVRTAVLDTALNDKALNDLTTQLLSVTQLARREPDRTNKTYARLVGGVFLDPLIEPGGPKASDRLFSWDDATVAEMIERNPGRLPANIVVTARDRPFLIVGGTLVSERRDYAYPLLAQVEYTPMYTGIRTSFGTRYGGTYVWSWAYDTTRVGTASDGTVPVALDPKRRFTLADVAASTSAAPQLLLLLGEGVPASLKPRMQQAAEYFPAFTHFSVHGDAPPILTPEIPHGDGGFVDNLGLMPLLARQVRNILVFVNTNTQYFEQNDDLKSYFLAIGPPDGGGDKTHNRVFDAAHYADLMKGLWTQHDKGQALVSCGTGWDVLENERYNIRGYTGLNICWFYNAAAPAWREQLPDAVKRIVDGHDGKNSTGFELFPWFSTFEQNKPHLIQLTVPQVNLLANLASWNVANDDSVRIVREALGSVVR